MKGFSISNYAVVSGPAGVYPTEKDALAALVNEIHEARDLCRKEPKPRDQIEATLNKLRAALYVARARQKELGLRVPALWNEGL